jgi:uncharacterized protein YukE
MAGMNVEVCRAQAEILETQAQKIKTVKTTIDGLVEELKQNWWGQDARDFAGKWEGTHKPELQKVQTKLKNVVQTIRTEAKEQVNASR